MARTSPDSPLLFDEVLVPDFSIEKAAIDAGHFPVAGTDEAGRGPLAGPVVAAAVILDPRNIPDGLNDSKKLTLKAREALFDLIVTSSLAVSFSSMSAETIDRVNILRASLEAMRRSVLALSIAPKLVLVDGRDHPPRLPCESRPLIKGDARSQSIAAASIVAKVMRDRIMAGCGNHHPVYGFETHAGYGTVRHRQAILESGALVRIHRMTFAPLKSA
ncbi:ribonuclease HII [Limoniibacter endophyticus]|uniref:Ribonuclease HII n=1 Tax=Limoniibacter endophyticus TaxID=1565040 RepID=A0A8J3DIS4_9HYPH|nr:ribonuclease HII [Limoniibacter endophyticus]GHC71295.1 ribonuclease HII [Limoniibacter endophyticus]